MDVNVILNVIDALSSDDSSDDENDWLLEHLLSEQRKIPKIRGFIENVVYYYTEKEFKSHFRVSRETCQHLIHLFENSEYCPRGPPFGGVPCKNGEEHILCYLWFAGNKAVFRTVSQTFDVSISTAHVLLMRVVDFLVNHVGPSVITFPRTVEEREEKAAAFEQIAGFPGVVGCIDGSFINIRTPAHKAQFMYCNRHDTTALTLQGICDANLRFIDCFTGVSGRMHDARIYSLSHVREKVVNMGPEHHIIGDAAYPLSVNLLTPYRDYRRLTEQQLAYNEHFSATRVKIENAFGVLKQRFRQLIRLDLWHVERASKFILSCCVVHNICLEREDFLENIERYVFAGNNDPPEFLNNAEERRLGSFKRDEIAGQLAT